MKLIAPLFLLIYITSSAQKCEVIDNFTSFKGVKLGGILPEKIKKISYGELMADKDTAYMLFNSTIKENPNFKELREYFYFGEFFEWLSFGMYKGKVSSFMWGKELDKRDSFALQKDESPYFYKAVYKELTDMFGKSTEQTKEEGYMSFSIIDKWNCKKIKVELEFQYTGLLPKYVLTISDIALESKKKLNKYSQ